MAVENTLGSSLAAQLWPERVGNRAVRAVALAVLGALLLTLSAKIKVPFWPVEMTMQTFVVLLIGAAYGPRLALATVGLYLAQGAMGLPVFTGTPERGIGLAYMAGPTGGFLLGFMGAALMAGLFAQRGLMRSLPGAFLALLAADAVVFLFGLGWLSQLIGWGPAVANGLAPFALSELVKIALAAAVVVAGQSVLSRREA